MPNNKAQKTPNDITKFTELDKAYIKDNLNLIESLIDQNASLTIKHANKVIFDNITKGNILQKIKLLVKYIYKQHDMDYSDISDIDAIAYLAHFSRHFKGITQGFKNITIKIFKENNLTQEQFYTEIAEKMHKFDNNFTIDQAIIFLKNIIPIKELDSTPENLSDTNNSRKHHLGTQHKNTKALPGQSNKKPRLKLQDPDNDYNCSISSDTIYHHQTLP